MENHIENYFSGYCGLPNHLSVGAAVMRNGKVCCHYFAEKAGYKDFYILMRETIDPGETIEQTLERGLAEEFNIKAKLVDFLGSIQSRYSDQNRGIEKTTIYFLCEYLEDLKSPRNTHDAEGDSEIKWMEPQELFQKMKEQSQRIKREDADESKIVEKLFK